MVRNLRKFWLLGNASLGFQIVSSDTVSIEIIMPNSQLLH